MVNYTIDTIYPLYAEFYWMIAFLPYLPLFGLGIVMVFSGLTLLTKGKLNVFVRKTVAAVYRTAIKVAADLGDEGLVWLRSEDGIKYRKGLVEKAYDLIPTSIGPVPVGLAKLLISRSQFTALVDVAFQEMVELAEKLELPQDIDPMLVKLLSEIPPK